MFELWVGLTNIETCPSNCDFRVLNCKLLFVWRCALCPAKLRTRCHLCWIFSLCCVSLSALFLVRQNPNPAVYVGSLQTIVFMKTFRRFSYPLLLHFSYFFPFLLSTTSSDQPWVLVHFSTPKPPPPPAARKDPLCMARSILETYCIQCSATYCPRIKWPTNALVANERCLSTDLAIQSGRNTSTMVDNIWVSTVYSVTSKFSNSKNHSLVFEITLPPNPNPPAGISRALSPCTFGCLFNKTKMWSTCCPAQYIRYEKGESDKNGGTCKNIFESSNQNNNNDVVKYLRWCRRL